MSTRKHLATDASASHRTLIAASLLIFIALVATPFNSFPAQTAGPERVKRGVPASETQQVKPFRSSPSPKALAWANAQLRRMSLDEKIGQLISIGVNGKYLNQDSEEYQALRRQIVENHIGGVILFQGQVYESVHLVNRMQEMSPYPLLVSADVEFGAAMRLEGTVGIPWNMAVGATGDSQYARRQGEIIAREARALGIRQIFAPVVDVNNNPDNPVINVRSYGEDPSKVAEFGAAFIEGAQSKGVIATAKHFPGHGDTAIDSHRGLPVINVEHSLLERRELVPFRAAIKAGVGSVMAAHIGLPQIDSTIIPPLPEAATTRSEYGDGSRIIMESAILPGSLSPEVLGKLLRTELHFDGLIVTDAMDMGALTIYFNQKEAALRAIKAGADMLIKPSDVKAAESGLHEAVDAERLKEKLSVKRGSREVVQARGPIEKRIEESARRILAAKYDLGLVARVKPITPLDGIDQLLSNREARDFAREVAEHAITLVRNDAGQVPIKPQANTRIFNLAITNGDDRLTIAAPFMAAMAQSGVHMDTVVLDGRSTEAEINQALEQAQGADIVIASLYGRVRSGEARSVGLPESNARALSQLISRRVPLIGISFGNPYLIRSFPEMQTYVVAYGDMPSLQEAAARALLGKTDISGRLPITLPSLPSPYPRGTGIQLKASLR